MDTWRPIIGDPTFLGWLTVTTYLIASISCFSISRNFRKSSTTEFQPLHYYFWFVLAIWLLLLCINKQLDLQTFLKEIVAQVSVSNGWYEHRRQMQRVFILGILSTTVLLIIIVSYYLRTIWREIWVALLGLLLISVYILIRASSFHHIDIPLNRMPLAYYSTLELIGILFIILSAFKTKYKKPAR